MYSGRDARTRKVAVTTESTRRRVRSHDRGTEKEEVGLCNQVSV